MLKNLIRERLGHGVKISLRPPLTHQSNRLYDVFDGENHWIAKEFLKPEEFSTSPIREHKTLAFLAPEDIAPQPSFYAPPSIGRGPVVVYKFMPGTMWDRKKPTADDLASLAELWLRMHAAGEKQENLWLSRGYQRDRDFSEPLEEQFRIYTDWASVHFLEGLRYEETWRGLLEKGRKADRQVREIDRAEIFCRADPRFANVIARPDGRLGMVDWEDAGLRDPALDIADMMTHPNQEDLLDEGEWDSFTGPYYTARRAIDPAIPDRVERYKLIVCLYRFTLSLSWGVRLANEGKFSGWEINEMEPNERIQRFLARCLAWPEGNFKQRLKDVEYFKFFDIGK